MQQLEKKVFLTGTIKCVTGLHIGGNKDTLEIGGIDTPVIRCVLKDRQPFIPGSSLKGKIRSLLQLAHGELDEKQTGSPICQLFGAADRNGEIDENNWSNYDQDSKNYLLRTFGEEKFKTDHKGKISLPGHKSRLIVRDCYLTQESKEQLDNNVEYTDMPYTEDKVENRIDRLTGQAKDPRHIERVPAESEFNVEMILNVYKGDSDSELLNLLHAGVDMLNDDYLGGNGSRGYGQIELTIDSKREKAMEDYKNKLEEQ